MPAREAQIHPDPAGGLIPPLLLLLLLLLLLVRAPPGLAFFDERNEIMYNQQLDPNLSASFSLSVAYSCPLLRVGGSNANFYV